LRARLRAIPPAPAQVVPPLRFDVARARDILLSSFWHRRSRAVNLKSRLEVFFVCYCGHVGNALALSKRSGMSTAPLVQAFRLEFTGSSQAFAVEVNPVGVMDQAVEDSVGVSEVADQCVPLIDGDLSSRISRMLWRAAASSGSRQPSR
jgi:hypothetical protein